MGRKAVEQKTRELVCFIRKKMVHATPEELIRQRLLQVMIGTWHYPAALISVEKSLSELSWGRSVPNRRIDIVAYHKVGHELLPLLLIECKAVALQKESWGQLLGYNEAIQAPFFALMAGDDFYCFAADGTAVAALPYYDRLLSMVTKSSPSTISTG